MQMFENVHEVVIPNGTPEGPACRSASPRHTTRRASAQRPVGPSRVRFGMTSARHLLFLCVLCFSVVQLASAQEIRGICLASSRGGYGGESCKQQLVEIKNLGANWIAINDYAWMNNVTSPVVRYGRNGRSPEGDQAQTIKNAHAAGLKVLLKPHIWSREFHGGKWHGDIQMLSEDHWDQWFASYTEYLLVNARLAEENGADGLCIGVEYEKTTEQEARWRKLIADVRAVYKGPICYSAAFMEWQKIKWWDAVDVVSITAYWPVGPKENPTDDDIRARWDVIYAEIEPFAKKWNKEVVFGEIGYTSSQKAAAEPWSADRGEMYEQQARLYRIAIEECQKRPFMKGVFLWKWFTDSRPDGWASGDPWTLQGRPLTLEAIKSAWK